MEFIIIRTIVIIVALITAFVVYNHILKPLIFEPMCLVNSNGCLRLGYYSYNNSALVHMGNTGYWIWFNGVKAYIYGQNVGQICKDPQFYTAAYVINAKTGLKEGYECVLTLDEVIKFYKSKGVTKMNYIIKRINNPNNYNAYDVLNLLSDKNIINLNTGE